MVCSLVKMMSTLVRDRPTGMFDRHGGKERQMTGQYPQVGDDAPVIEVTHVVKRHSGRAVVDDVSFAAQAGRVTAFLGPNGAGKSSTLRILLGLDHADSGTATLCGLPYARLPSPLHTVGFTLDGPGANRGRSARNHLKWVAMTAGITMSRVDEVLRVTGLSGAANMKVGAFSLGMGQRLGLATALLGDPRVLILDEPMNGLDPEGIRWIREFVRRQAARGVGVLVSSHLMSQVESIADDVVVIAQGHVLASGTLCQVRGSTVTLRRRSSR